MFLTQQLTQYQAVLWNNILKFVIIGITYGIHCLSFELLPETALLPNLGTQFHEKVILLIVGL